MPDHDERVREINSHLPSAAELRHANRKKPSPGWQRQYRKDMQKTCAYLDATLVNGAGLLMDKELRIAFHEFNDRWMRLGPHTMPTAFNVLEAFFRYDVGMRILQLRPEVDHLFSFSDFVDFVTSPDAPGEAGSLLHTRFTERQIYSYTVYDDPHDLTFSTPQDKEIGMGGVSFIRHGDELSIFLVAGQETDLEAESDTVAELAQIANFTPGKGYTVT